MLPPNACFFVANLSQARIDEQLEYSVTSIFQAFGDVYVKIRQDCKGMPYAFCQYESGVDAQQVIILGRGVPIDGRPCRTEVAKANRSLYLSKVTGGCISESEAHQVLSRFGALEKVWYCSQTEKEMFRLSEGIWVMSAFFQDCRDAQVGFRENVQYRLEQPRIPGHVTNRVGNLSFQPLPILRSKSTIKEPPKKLNIQRAIDLYSIFVGNLPLQAKEPSLKKVFRPFGRACRIELTKKSSVPQNHTIAFAFIGYSTAEEAASATQGVFMLLGSRLRVQQKENLYLNPSRFGHAFAHTRPMGNRFNPDDEAISMIFQRDVSVGTAKATNFQGAGVVQSSIPPTTIQYPLNSGIFGSQNPSIAPGTYAQYPFYPASYSFNDGRKTLDQILDNPYSTTNICIRGFDPNNTDTMIQQYGSPFGEIKTAKSIIDRLTNTCKGYGFIKYYSFADAENCVRGFYYRGYEAKFAKLGHIARLKTFHGKTSSKETDFTILQLRYADTNEQKMFKMETTNWQILKANKYNTVIYGTGSPTSRNVLRLLITILFAAPCCAEVVKLEEEPKSVQRLYNWSGVITMTASLIGTLLSMVSIIVAVLALRRVAPAKDTGKVEEIRHADVESAPSPPPQLDMTLSNNSLDCNIE